MADPNTRQGKRTPVTLKIKFKSETLEQFIERYAVDVSQGGIFIRTKEPLAVGTQMKFEFQLRDASPLIAGEGTVVWTRENDPSRPAIAPGMGVRFDRLADGSQAVLERILAEKAKQAPGRGAGTDAAATKPPLFTDTPTKVAPAPLQEALGIGTRRPRSDSEQTPLPPPRPFHSDADDFDEKAFEEATKVRSLDELAAQTAGLVGGAPASDPADDAPTNTAVPMPPDELAARRGGRGDLTNSEPAEPPVTATVLTESGRESAPGLPEPPRRPSAPSKQPIDKPSDKPVEEARNKLGIEPAKARTRGESVPPRAESALPPAPAKSSAASIVILLLVLVAGGAAAVWWFVLREKAVEEVAQTTDTGGVADGSDQGSSAMTGSDGSGAMTGNDGSNAFAVGNGSAGSAAVEPTIPAAQVDTMIGEKLPKTATIEVVGTDQKGNAPLTAKLEKDKVYKARVTAPGFMVSEIEVKGGEKATAKLIPKPRVINVTTDPPGADIYVDGVNTQKLTPSEVELTAAQAAKPRVRIALRRSGYRTAEQTLDAKTFKESDAQMTASINAKLAVVQRPQNTGGTGTTGTTGSGTTGSGTTGSGTTGSGTGSAVNPTGSGTTGTGTGTGTTGTGAGAGTGTTGTGTGTTGTGTGTTGTGTGTGAGAGTTGTGAGAGSAKPPTPTPTPTPGTGSATKPAAGSASPSASSGEPEPTWTK